MRSIQFLHSRDSIARKRAHSNAMAKSGRTGERALRVAWVAKHGPEMTLEDVQAHFSSSRNTARGYCQSAGITPLPSPRGKSLTETEQAEEAIERGRRLNALWLPREEIELGPD